jgi:ankyrin repeat protein
MPLRRDLSLTSSASRVDPLSEPKGTTALLAAASSGHAAVVKELLRRNASVSLLDAWGHTPLLQAIVTAKSTDVVLEFLEGLAGDLTRRTWLVNKGNRMLVTPLHAAAEHGLQDVAAALIGAGAQLEAKTRTGETPLMKAVGEGDNNLGLVRLLLEKGASPAAADSRGKSSIDLAGRNK